MNCQLSLKIQKKLTIFFKVLTENNIINKLRENDRFTISDIDNNMDVLSEIAKSKNFLALINLNNKPKERPRLYSGRVRSKSPTLNLCAYFKENTLVQPQNKTLTKKKKTVIFRLI